MLKALNFTLLRRSALWLLTSIALATEVATGLGFRLRRGYAGQVAGFRKDAPRLAAGCFTIPIMAGYCLAMLMTTGCEDNNKSPTPDPPAIDVSGTWGLQDDLEDVHTMVLSQSGSQLTGSVSAFVGKTTPVVGFISDINITLFMSVGTSNTVDFVGLASANSMSGTWRNSSAQTEGTWTAIRK